MPKRHIVDSFDLTRQELDAVFDQARQVRAAILGEDSTVGRFNFGSNIGVVAGQKIPHAHFHLIPRRPDEEPLPHAKA